MSIQKSLVFRDAPARTLSSAAATKGEIKAAPYIRGATRATDFASYLPPLNNPRADAYSSSRRSTIKPPAKTTNDNSNGKALLMSAPRRVSSQMELLPSSVAAARTAAATAAWVDTLNMLEVLDVEDACEMDVATQASFLLSHTHSRSTSTVLTDTDIEDECRSTDSASSVETASPMHGYRPPRKHHSRCTAGHRSAWEESVATDLADYEDNAAYDFSASVLALDHRSAAKTRKNSEVALPRIMSQGVRSNESSANLDKFHEEKERRTGSGYRPLPSLNRHASYAAMEVEEEIPEEII